MPSIDEIQVEQNALAEELSKQLQKTKKTEIAKRTAALIERRRLELSRSYEHFMVNHEKAKQLNDPDHPYFTSAIYSDFVDNVKEMEQVLERFQSQIANTEAKQRLDQPLPERTPSQNKPKNRKIKYLSQQKERIKRIQQRLADFENDIQEQRTVKMDPLNLLSTEWEKCVKLHEQIWNEEYDSTDDYFEDGYMEDLNNNIELRLFKLKDMVCVGINKEESPSIRLPEIRIPTFTGKYEEWPEFRDMFTYMIHNKQQLSNVEKLQYLKTFVQGEPSRLIKTFATNNVNYEAAWEMLSNRYSNTRLTVKTLLDKIFNFPKIQFESYQKLKELHDTVQDCTIAIKNLGVRTTDWDPIIDYMIASKWDDETNRLYEQGLENPHEIQDHQRLMRFLVNRFQSLELSPKKQLQNQHKNVRVSLQCYLCRDDHMIKQCQKFKSMTSEERWKVVREKKLCQRCLQHTTGYNCLSQDKCEICSRDSHHTMLHDLRRFGGSNANRAQVHSATITESAHVLLATALVRAKSKLGTWLDFRVLLDGGSQVSLITENAAQLLALPREKVAAKISGINDGSSMATTKMTVQLHPRFPSAFSCTSSLFILKKVTSQLPQVKMQDVNHDEWRNYHLADPTFNIPGPVDMLIGADALGDILMGEILRTTTGPLAQKTEFGWVLSGLAKTAEDKTSLHMISMVSRQEEDEQLTKFWQIEEVAEDRPLTQNERNCEAIYEDTTVRNTDGTYTVKIPFCQNTELLGESKPRAIARFQQLEKKLSKNHELRLEYNKFMLEYINLGHMAHADKPGKGKYYIPHQAVLKEDSSTTKLRVVFDASCKTSSGVSLNQLMYNGPRLQDEISAILLRWRLHRIVFKADIEKMYRQIKIHEADQDYQRILWRFSSDEPIREYKLLTVTYGTTAAPYLAVKTLQRLASDEKHRFPLAEKSMKDFYVDDILSGADTVTEALQIQQQLNSMMQSGGFKLRKWSSNDRAMIDSLSEDLQDNQDVHVDHEALKKSLGVQWSPAEDIFMFKVTITELGVPTKRKILAEIARLYDPLGWLTPITVTAKMMIQELWVKNLDWDAEVPSDIKIRWERFYNTLKTIEQIRIPRWIHYTKRQKSIQIHGFADASEKAYGAVIYSRITEEDNVIVRLLTSKSKVAPIKMKKTLPRLELCAAVLLAKLMQQTKETLKHLKIETHAWTDSTITLAWIKGEPGRWRSFVANRVASIIEVIPEQNWRHVTTECNPADPISRGVEPSKLLDMKLWWNGPDWLKKAEDEWPSSTIIQPTVEEAKLHTHTITTADKPNNEIIDRFSSLTRMIRVMAYCKRFIAICKKESVAPTNTLSQKELDESLKMMIRICQCTEFPNEVKALKKSEELVRTSKLISLKPFMDNEHIIRVGGRIHSSTLPFDQRHPFIIPRRSTLTTLIVRHAHATTLHGGIQSTLAYCRRRFWIIHGRESVRSVIHRCPICRRYKGETLNNLMGNLPEARITPSHPFSHSGVDYAGPIQVRVSKGRGNKSYKGYIAIFVCFSTKAVHLEVVSDMTADAFVAAFRRFIARRGPCHHLYSDNGTTFVGSRRLVEDKTGNMGTQWHFIPPSAPHFGGLWESAVKSMKHHMKRVIGESTLTYEELSTLTQQIEACLNSRPLWPLNNDSEDIEPLTPGHFLIGRPLIYPNGTDNSFDERVIDAKTRWKLIQKMNTDFWNTWSSEYLHTLQQRRKWETSKENVKVGDVVLVKDDCSPPGCWPLARIAEVHPANDGTIRVVTLKQADRKTSKRPITKLIPIDTTENAANSNGVRVPRLNTLLAWLCLLICLIGTVADASYILKDIQPGLYIEHIGTTKINRGVFRLEVVIPKQRLYEHANQVNITIWQMNELCHAAEGVSKGVQCAELVHHLNEQLTEFQWVMKGILNSTKRRKRGILGKMLTEVFGVNEEVYHDIDALDTNQQKLIRTSKQQKKLLLSSMTQNKQAEERTNRTLMHLSNKLNQVTKTLNDMKSWFAAIDYHRINIHIINVFQLANNYIGEVHSQCRNLLAVYTNRGHIYDFLSPAEVRDNIKRMSQKLPSHLQILQNPVIKTSYRQNDSAVMIQGHFLISEVAAFNLIKVTPTPVKFDGNSYWIQSVNTAILAIDYDSQQYFEIKSSDLAFSIQLDNHAYISSPTIVRSIEHSPNCVIDQIYDRFNTSRCPIKKVMFKGIVWQQLLMPNTWMYILCEPITFAVTCSGRRDDVTVNHTGIIHLTGDCSITTQQTIISPTLTPSIPVLSTALKSTPFSSINWTLASYFTPSPNLSHEPMIKLSSTNENPVQHDDLADPDDETWRKIRHHSTTTSMASTCICFVILISFIYVGRRLAQRFSCCRHNHRTTPMDPEDSDNPNIQHPTATTPLRATTVRSPAPCRRQDVQDEQ